MVALRLFLPESWTSDLARLKRAGVAVEYRTARTKPEIALAAAGGGPQNLVKTIEYVTPAALECYRIVADVRSKLLREPLARLDRSCLRGAAPAADADRSAPKFSRRWRYSTKN